MVPPDKTPTPSAAPPPEVHFLHAPLNLLPDPMSAISKKDVSCFRQSVRLLPPLERNIRLRRVVPIPSLTTIVEIAREAREFRLIS